MKPNHDPHFSSVMENLSDVARRLGATAPAGEADASFRRVTTDTRQLRKGDLFVALKGDRFDGHDFVLRAASIGAVGVLVSRAIPSGPPQIVVPDTLVALQSYASSWRADYSVPVVAVTGSNGKTTTKQLLAAILSVRGPVLATDGNLNNHIGVPLTLLRLRNEHRTAVIEMGANHAGEIARLAAIAKPDVGIVTMAGDAHLEGFGSRLGVARAKGELFSALGSGSSIGVAIVNVDDPSAGLWRQLAARASLLLFGFAAGADVRAERVELHADACRFQLITPAGRADVRLPLPGRHNITNALAAAAAAVTIGVAVDDIAERLATITPVAGRLNWKSTPGGARLLDDTYNANPTSLRAALELLSLVQGPHWLVLGDMKELGESAADLHSESGRIARQLGINRLYTVGALARHAADGFGKGFHFGTMEALIEALRTDLQSSPEVAVLVKGSRSSQMERVVAALTGEQPGEAH